MDALPSQLALRFEGGDGAPMRAILAGEVDMAVAPAMQERITAARREQHATRVIMDLAGVEFIDSSGLRAVLHLHRELADEGGVLVLLHPSEDVQHVLALTGLDQHLNVASDAEQATALLAGGGAAEEAGGKP
jgi:anti-sigma B factor antagonist